MQSYEFFLYQGWKLGIIFKKFFSFVVFILRNVCRLMKYIYICGQNFGTMKNIFLALSCIALLAGCQQSDEIENMSEELLLSIEASIGDTQNHLSSRYSSSDETPNNLIFDVGNSIGLFMEGKDLVEWTKTQSGWSSEKALYWPNKSDNYDFYAYYPYAEATSIENVPMPSLAGQLGTIASLSDCDFLVAFTNQNYGTDGTVSFTGTDASFKHVSSLVAVTVKGDCDLKESLIKNISFAAAGIASRTTYSFATNTTALMENGESDKMESGSLDCQMAGEDKTFYFILNPGIALSDVTFCIKYATADVDYKAEKAGLGSVTLARGGRYNFNLSISDGVLTLSGGEIQNWGDGTQMDDIEINNPIVDNN